MLELNKIYEGDCLEVMQSIDSKSIDMVLTDIPYGEVNRKSAGLRALDKGVADVCELDLQVMIDEYKRVLNHGTVYIFCGTKQISYLTEMLQDCGMSTRLGLWEKSNPSPMNGDKVWLSGAEFCVIGRQKNAVFNRHCEKPIWKYPCGRNKFHPTEKPLQLMEYLIESSTNVGGVVLDNCCGSGTTCVAASMLGRKFVGIEKEHSYVEISNERLRKATIQKLENLNVCNLQ